MAYIILPNRWRQQPIGPVELNYSNELGQRILAAYPLNSRQGFGRNAGQLTLGAGTYANGLAVSAKGEPIRSFLGDGSSYLALPRTPFKDATSPVSIAFFVRSTSTTAQYQGFFTSKAPGATNPTCIGWSTANNYWLYCGNQGSSPVPAGINVGVNAVGVPRRGVVVMKSGPTSGTHADYIGYVDGVGRVWGGSAGGWSGTTTDHQRIGDDGQNSKWSGHIGDIVVFDGALSDAEAWDYIYAPYQIYRPIVRRIYVPSAGTTGTAVGSSTGAATAAATGKSIVNSVGSSAGVATAAATGKALFNSVGSSAGVATAAATGTTSTGSYGASAGVATAAATGKSIVNVVGASAGVATTAATGKSLFNSVGSSAGVATAAATGDYIAAGSTVGSSAGTATAAAVGSSLFIAAASSAGTSTAAATGSFLATRSAVGSSAGTSTAAATSTSEVVLTLEQKCDLVLKLLMNKTVTDPDTGVMTVYDDDDTTVLYTANVFEDAAGTIAYRGQGIERRERFTPPN